MGTTDSFDLVVLGGGIAGATLGRCIARAGFHVLIVEKDKAFRDRIRGEVLLPWGSAEAKELGIYDILLNNCGNELPREYYVPDGELGTPREFPTSTPKGTSILTFYHPDMQEVLLNEAAAAGAEVLRGWAVKSLDPGANPEVEIAGDGAARRIRARLIVGADGRESQVATLLGFTREKDPEELFSGGLQFSGDIPADRALYFFLHGLSGRGAILAMNKPGNYRAYVFHHRNAMPRRWSGERDYPLALAHFRDVGMPADWVGSLTPHGIFATFDGSHRWITRPVRGCCVLIGDAAAASDPVWGCGLSRTLRDVRLLRDRLLDNSDWQEASEAFAIDHDDFFHRLRRLEHLKAALAFSMGEEGEALRKKAALSSDSYPELALDTSGLGPEAPYSDRMRQFLLGS
jgi:2-polyprenyl-6-methoxyphenol hydroxylase-like FAD-dependent oxidoreductase